MGLGTAESTGAHVFRVPLQGGQRQGGASGSGWREDVTATCVSGRARRAGRGGGATGEGAGAHRGHRAGGYREGPRETGLGVSETSRKVAKTKHTPDTAGGGTRGVGRTTTTHMETNPVSGMDGSENQGVHGVPNATAGAGAACSTKNPVKRIGDPETAAARRRRRVVVPSAATRRPAGSAATTSR